MRTKPADVEYVTYACLSSNVTTTVPRIGPSGSPELDEEAYNSRTTGVAMEATMNGLEKSSPFSGPAPGHTHVHLSKGGTVSSERSQIGLPEEQTGQPQDPQEYKSKFPFVHPNLQAVFVKHDTRRTPINRRPKHRPMAFAPSGDPKEMSEGVEAHVSLR